jgi:hypothetical protein
VASYSAAAGDVAVHDKTLVASTVDTVTFTDDLDRVEVISDGAAALYFTTDGSTPTVSGAKCWPLLSGVANTLNVQVDTAGGTVVKLISSGTPKYSVVRGDK